MNIEISDPWVTEMTAGEKSIHNYYSFDEQPSVFAYRLSCVSRRLGKNIGGIRMIVDW